ncbi:mechanosensitive ion channel family protein [Burkholderia plantarii]|uniref:MscS mechanosensitive ion channel n=1 Tax=Burkholderia plantarii TaxID=41899 RepID=A0A0B6RU22_BURPL|nr:mechanosensitive ion channel domain-containing protein [Burkholderia plantarii]AJK45674.1 MscS mechanosensitive ion channel [Burkholderia plantarii]
MRQILIGWLLAIVVTSAQAAAPAAAPASAASTAVPPLTPQQAQQALTVLENPRQRAQFESTLRAIAAAGALSTPAAPASAASAASPASAAPAASSPTAFLSNGLASQLMRQGSHWAAQIGNALRDSMRSLLDVGSVGAWWRTKLTHANERADFASFLQLIIAALAPALLIEWLARRLLRRALTALAARRAGGVLAGEPSSESASESALESPAAPSPADADAAADTLAAAGTGASAAPRPDEPDHAQRAAHATRGRGHALRHSTLLQRMPRALVSLALRAIPLLVFVGVATLMMSILTDDDTPAANAIGSLVDIYVICRAVAIVSRLFFQPDAPQLRLLHIGDTWAAFTQHWIRRIVIVIGACSAVVETAGSFGLSDAGHVALMKAVALIGHVMVSILILQCSRPVAAWIRAQCSGQPSLAVLGNALADAWAPVAVFIVMALWFVWALDVHNGYHVLIALGGRSIAVMIGMRIVSIVVFGALARLFERHGSDHGTVMHRHAYRYYPLLRQVVSGVVGIVTLLLLLQIWGVPVARAFEAGTIGHRLASALVTIAIAALVALLVWESANIAIERRLDRWTKQGNLMRAARLRTLLPMLRSLLFVLIALVVVLTGLSELGVNVGPLLAGASIFGVALGFGSQKLVQDFITGIFLLMENAMQVGDWVTLAGVSGTVEYLSIRTVRLRAGDGSLHTVPFSSVSTVNNTNRGLGNAAVKVSILYSEDIDRAVETLKEIGAALREDPKYKDGILSDFAYWGVDSVDGSAITMSGQVQCRDSGRWGVQREFNRRIAVLFAERGIRIANPQRTVYARDPAGAGDGGEAGGDPRDPDGGSDRGGPKDGAPANGKADASSAAAQADKPSTAAPHAPPPTKS